MSEVKVTKNTTTVVPKGIVEAKIKVSKPQMDILSIILAEIGKATDKDDNLIYTVTSEDLSLLIDTDVHTSRKNLREFICENNRADTSMRLIGFDLFLDDDSFEHYNWFSSVKYHDGIATFTLTPEIKSYLVAFKKKDQYKVYAKLRYILPMKSVYSKRIYLMCREFIGSGKRFCDTDWELFKEKLVIPPTYNTYMIRKTIMKAVEEINELSDIEVSFQIDVETKQGGETPKSIRFFINTKYNTEEDIITDEEKEETNIQDMSVEDLQQKMAELQELINKKMQGN